VRSGNVRWKYQVSRRFHYATKKKLFASLIASIVLSLLIAVDRVYAILHPLKYRVLAGRRSLGLGGLVVAWTYSALIGALMFVDTSPDTLVVNCLLLTATSTCGLTFFPVF